MNNAEDLNDKDDDEDDNHSHEGSTTEGMRTCLI